MSDRLVVAIVDDDRTVRTIEKTVLQAEYEIVEFAAGEVFLERRPETLHAVLLDIEMTGMSGYETCRQFRMAEDIGHIPVIFVSGHDTPEERVAAYEAGGDDFVTKPIAADELRFKLQTLIAQHQRLQELESQSSMASQIAFSAMSSMGDLGVVIEFMRASATARSYSELARRLLDALHAWGLAGAVQVRGREGRHDEFTESTTSPLQATVMNNLRNMGRIFEMGSRAVVNFPHVSLLVNNLPTDDPDKVGRIRDHLAVLAESADSRIEGLDAITLSQRQHAGISGALQELIRLLTEANQRAAHHRLGSERRMQDVFIDIANSMKAMGLTPVQETLVQDLLQSASDDMLTQFDEATRLNDNFSTVLASLAALGDVPPEQTMTAEQLLADF